MTAKNILLLLLIVLPIICQFDQQADRHKKVRDQDGENLEGEPDNQIFEKWEKKHEGNFKEEGDKGKIFRKLVFIDNLGQIKEHNRKQGNHFKKGLTQFSSMTHQEFKSRLLTARPHKINKVDIPQITSKAHKHTKSRNLQTVTPSAYPQIDWQKMGKVTSVKNQGVCGSCWAYSAVAALQAAYYVQKNANLDLSEQQLVDCSTEGQNDGCTGGWHWDALIHAYYHKLRPESQYKTAWDTIHMGHKAWCDPWRDNGTYGFNGYRHPEGETEFLQDITYKPLAVSFLGSTMQHYKGGIFDGCPDPEKQQYEVDHSALLVGTGVDKQTGLNYWKIKSSWGTEWGEDGYVRMLGGNTCNILKWYGIGVYLS